MKIPAKIHEIFCPICGCRIEFPLFLSSFYGYATYKEINSQQIVRIDIEGLHHRNIEVNELLAKYSEAFNNPQSPMWVNLQETNYCPKCKKCFKNKDGNNCRFCVEENIETVTLPKCKT